MVQNIIVAIFGEQFESIVYYLRIVCYIQYATYYHLFVGLLLYLPHCIKFNHWEIIELKNILQSHSRTYVFLAHLAKRSEYEYTS